MRIPDVYVRSDWATATNKGRRLLYKAVQRVRDEFGLEWPDIYSGAFGKATSTGIDYENNFRAGKIHRRKAAQIYNWLRKTHPAHADRFLREVKSLAIGPAVRTMTASQARRSRQTTVNSAS